LSLSYRYQPDLDIGDIRGKNVFHRVCASKDLRYFHKLLKTYGEIPESVMDQSSTDGVTPVITACQNGNPEQLKELLDKGVIIFFLTLCVFPQVYLFPWTCWRGIPYYSCCLFLHIETELTELIIPHCSVPNVLKCYCYDFKTVFIVQWGFGRKGQLSRSCK